MRADEGGGGLGAGFNRSTQANCGEGEETGRLTTASLYCRMIRDGCSFEMNRALPPV